MTGGPGGRGPANIMKPLKDIDFPVSKKKVLSQARQAPGPDTDQVLDVLERIPDKEYGSPAEIMKEVSKIE